MISPCHFASEAAFATWFTIERSTGAIFSGSAGRSGHNVYFGLRIANFSAVVRPSGSTEGFWWLLFDSRRHFCLGFAACGTHGLRVHSDPPGDEEAPSDIFFAIAFNRTTHILATISTR
jgi:hypothetical protein